MTILVACGYGKLKDNGLELVWVQVLMLNIQVKLLMYSLLKKKLLNLVKHVKCGHIKTGDEKLFLWGDKYGNDHNTYVCYNCGIIQDRTENAILNLVNYGK